MKNSQYFFLAANSCEGFVSHFNDNYDCFDGWRVYIIKGGPGTGKSSFMRKIAVKATESGINPLLCPCSSDPDSLDAVILENQKIIILDGTSPHVVEPMFPGAAENIINLGEYWDSDKLFSNREKIIDVTLKNKLLHKAASRYLAAAGHIFTDNLKISSSYIDTARAKGFADGLSVRLIPEKSNRCSKEWVRFISGITPAGIINFTESITDFYENIIVISDRFGGVSSIITSTIHKRALDEGYQIISLKNPFVPSLIYDHILIPELSLAIVTENNFITFNTEHRKIHARRFTDINTLNNHREKLRFNDKIFKELLLSAGRILSQAKDVHDELESYYISAMDYNKSSLKADALWNEITKNFR
ncbi:MAG: hypothetical protein IKK24_00180 [Clostridia bacterium]|nr:hypothetical protein [Clostridia bacterium]